MEEYHGKKTGVSVRLCDTDRPSERMKVNADEPDDRTEDRDHFQQAADHP